MGLQFGWASNWSRRLNFLLRDAHLLGWHLIYKARSMILMKLTLIPENTTRPILAENSCPFSLSVFLMKSVVPQSSPASYGGMSLRDEIEENSRTNI